MRRSRPCAPRSTACRSEAILWNSLATVLAEEGRAEESLVFYKEAVRLEPSFARGYHNLGYAYQHLGQLEEALANYDQALEHVVDPAERSETRHSRSICLIGAGQAGGRLPRIRNPQQRALPRLSPSHDQGAALEGRDRGRHEAAAGRRAGPGRRIHVRQHPARCAARDLGPDGKLQIAVDPRLVPLFQRCFPGCRSRHL